MFHVTQNLLLRPAWPEDADALFGGIADEGIVRNLARAPWPYLPHHAHDYVSVEKDPRLPSFLLTLPSEHGSRLVGCAGLGEGADGVELGYWIARPFWGRGYATEAARGVLEVARMLGHERISAGHFTDNPASGRVLRKVGFTPTGRTVSRHSCGRGGDADCVMYTLDLGDQDSERQVAA